MFKEQKGITLVALVITIIVLLILAGVSISLVVGQDGVLGKAQGAVSATEKATAGQEIELSISEAQMAYMEAWTKDQSVEKIKYYKTPDFYHRNCVSTAKANVLVYSNGDNVYVSYKSKSNVTYLATFDVTAPSTSYKMLAPDETAADGTTYKSIADAIATATKTADDYDPDEDVTPSNPAGGNVTNPDSNPES